MERLHAHTTHFSLKLLLRISSGFRFQFLRDPLIKPAITTNTNTSTLTQVNTLFTIADSFTPNASSPENNTTLKGGLQNIKRQDLFVPREEVKILFALCSNKIPLFTQKYNIRFATKMKCMVFFLFGFLFKKSVCKKKKV